MNYSISEFYCTKCGNKGISLPRKDNKRRKSGHLKKLYCCHCKEEVNHVEIRDGGSYTYEDFLDDYYNGNFK